MGFGTAATEAAATPPHNPLKRPIAPQGRGGEVTRPRPPAPAARSEAASAGRVAESPLLPLGAADANPAARDEERNRIAAELLCSICRKLPVDPVTYRGKIYERSEIEFATKRHPAEVYPFNQIKRVIELLVRGGNLDEKYLGKWSDGGSDDNIGIPVETTCNDAGEKDVRDLGSLRCSQGPSLRQLREPVPTSDENEAASNVDSSNWGDNTPVEIFKPPAEPSVNYRNAPGRGDKHASEINQDEHCLLLKLKREAEAGNADSMVELGELYLKGGCNETDKQESFHWFEQASEKSNALGTARKADCLLAGLGVQQNIEEGQRILLQAASEDDSAAAALRLWHYHIEGMHGFKPKRADKKLERLKNISPHLSSEDIQKLKEDLADLISSSSTGRKSDVHTQVKMDHITRPKLPCAKLENTSTRTASEESFTTQEAIQNSCDKVEGTPDGIFNSPQASTGNTANVKEKQGLSAAPTTGPEKQCAECDKSKPKDAFATSQWKMPRRTGRCLDCCVVELVTSRAPNGIFESPKASIGDKTSVKETKRSRNNIAVEIHEAPAGPSINYRKEPGVVDQDALENTYDEEVLLLQTEAEAGNANSMVELGELYLKGGCIENEDEQKAYYWFQQASKKENALGTARKADCLLAGLGVQQDVEEGQHILVQAASEDDSADAALRLWYYYSEEMHGFKPKRADKNLERLKDISPHLSHDVIHHLKEELADLISSSSTGRKSDVNKRVKVDQTTHLKLPYAKMKRTPMKAALEESTATQENIEKSCDNIEHVNIKDQSQNDNMELATFWAHNDTLNSSQASTGDKTNAKEKQERENTLTVDVLRAPGSPSANRNEPGISDEKYLLLLKTEAEAGHADSMVELGELYLQGCCIETDKQRAFYWFVQASEKENALGTARKADCLLAGLGVQQNVEEGQHILFQAAIEDDSVDAALRLWYYHNEEMYGLKLMKAEKNLERLKVISPHLSGDDIQNLKEELVELISSSSTERKCDGEKQMKMDQTISPKLPHPKTEHRSMKTAMDFSSPQASTGDNANANEQRGVIAAPTAAPEKQCSSCKKLKSNGAFTPSQWKRTRGTGRCIDCCEKDIATSQKSCVSCNTKERDAFTTSQWKLSAGTGRCKECCKKGENVPSVSEHPTVSKESKDATDVEESNQQPVKPRLHSGKETGIAMEDLSDEQENEEICGLRSFVQSVGPVHTSDDVSSLTSAVFESTPHVHVKPCFECGKSQPQTGFTASQWKKRLGTGRCLHCVSKSPQWQTGIVASSLQAKLCCECNVSKPHTDFSPNQWRRSRGTGRCKNCVKKVLP